MKFFVLNNKGLEKLRRNLRLKKYKDYVYWINGYAIPENVLKEIGLSKKYIRYSIDESFLVAEPDANLEIALNFCRKIFDHENMKKMRVLDIASGFGYVPALLSKRYDVIATDLNYLKRIKRIDGRFFVDNTNIEIFVNIDNYNLKYFYHFSRFVWKKLGGDVDRIFVISCDVSKIPLKDSSIDIVTCFFSFNHISNWKKCIDEIYRVLKHGGKVYVTLYKEILEKFPIKGSYNWLRDLSLKIIDLNEFRNYVKKLFNEILLEEHLLHYEIVLSKIN